MTLKKTHNLEMVDLEVKHLPLTSRTETVNDRMYHNLSDLNGINVDKLR